MIGKISKYGVLLALLAVVAASIIYGIAANSSNAALFLNGVMANFFDPLVWLIVLPFALMIRKDAILLPSLFTVAALVCIFKLYMQHKTGARWISGSILGNVVGFITVGYVVNAVAVFFRSRRVARGGA